jgi:two-component system response regulator CpxR
MKVLIIDDDHDLTQSLFEYLREQCIALFSAGSAEAGSALLSTTSYDAIILDVMLPGQSGFDILPALRRQTATPILLLTALGEEHQRVAGLELGADDYLTKPFSAKELVARLRAIQRRVQSQPNDQLSLGDLRLEPAQHTVYVGQTAVTLTGMETRILETLLRAANHRVSRELLHTQVLGRGYSPMDRSLDVHVSNLRRKLRPHPEHGTRIRAIRGYGYVLSN